MGGGIPIVFIHFPALLEEREFYLQRARLIERAIQNLARESVNLYSISVPDNFVFPAIGESGLLKNFPYHYANITKEYVSGTIDRILNSFSSQE